MTFLNAMNTPNHKHRQSGYSLLETLVAIGIASIIMTSALGVVASIYYSQKRIQFSQDFYAEGRYLMERIGQSIRNNTIDYDYFFEQNGPPDGGGVGACGSSFDSRQVPNGDSTLNTAANRAELGYETIFFWDTNNDTVQNRNLGGKDPAGDDDPCVLAWDPDLTTNPINTLYLINAARDLRTTIRFNAGTNKIDMRKQLAADTDDDGRADIWGPLDVNGDGGTGDFADGDVDLVWTGTQCELRYGTSGFVNYAIIGDAASLDFCEQAFDFSNITPAAIRVNSLTFRPAPNKDPFLAFRLDSAQVQPHVSMFMDLELDNPSNYGFESDDKPVVSLQTAVGSRVFGNIRR